MENIELYMNRIGQQARAASRAMARADTAAKNQALLLIAAAIRRDADALRAANALDLDAARANGLAEAMLDRLTLSDKAIATMAEGLERVVKNAADPGARADCLYGAWLCGTVLGHVGMALHHKLCHTLGGSFNLPHAPAHTVVLPHAIAYNAEAAPEAAQRICRALGVSHGLAGAALYDLAERLGAPLTLRELGLNESDLDKATDIALANPYWNPRPIERDGIRQLLQDAFDGRRPRA